MAITSIGYPNTIAPGSATALWHAAAGRPYVFPAENQVKPNNPAVGTRRVTLSAGRFSGKGITDYNDAVVNLDLPAPVGSSQWFAIVANRWVDEASTPASPIPSGAATRFGWVAGTATKAIPAVTQTPGTFDQQLIALALVESGQQYIRQLVDLRAIGDEGGVYTIFDQMALQTITRPGARAYNAVTGLTYECTYDSARALDWRRIYTDREVFSAATPPSGRMPQIRTGSAAVATNPSGDFTISLASPFPSGFLTAVLTDATSPTALGSIILKQTQSASTRTAITGRAYAGNNGAALANSIIQVSYVATGY